MLLDMLGMVPLATNVRHHAYTMPEIYWLAALGALGTERMCSTS